MCQSSSAWTSPPSTPAQKALSAVRSAASKTTTWWFILMRSSWHGPGRAGQRGGFGRRLRAAVEPQRPGIPGQACGDVALVARLDHVQGLLAGADRAADDDEPVVDQLVHEGRVLIPAVLLPDRARGVPAWAVHQPDREVGHGRSVLAAADILRAPSLCGPGLCLLALV